MPPKRKKRKEEKGETGVRSNKNNKEEENQENPKPRPVNTKRFPIVDVKEDATIAELQSALQIVVPHQRGFYSLARNEPKISKAKDIIAVQETNSKNKGDDSMKAMTMMYYGVEARQILGMPTDRDLQNVKPADYPDYTVFVQSTSHNRKLQAGWKLLYEVPSEPLYLEEEEKNEEDDNDKKPAAKNDESESENDGDDDKEEEHEPAAKRTRTTTTTVAKTPLPTRRSTRQVVVVGKRDPPTPSTKQQPPPRGSKRKKPTSKEEDGSENDDLEAGHDTEEADPQDQDDSHIGEEHDDNQDDTKKKRGSKKQKESPRKPPVAKTKQPAAAANCGHDDNAVAASEWISCDQNTMLPVGYPAAHQHSTGEPITTGGVMVTAREAFRAVQQGDQQLLKELVHGKKYRKQTLSPVQQSWSVNCAWTPLDKAIESEQMQLIKILLTPTSQIEDDNQAGGGDGQDCRHNTIPFAQMPLADALRVDAGEMSHQTLGYRRYPVAGSRHNAAAAVVGVSRGGKEGNNALIADILGKYDDNEYLHHRRHSPTGMNESAVKQVVQNLDVTLIKSTKMVDYIRVLNRNVTQTWGAMGFYRFCEAGNYVAAGRVAEILRELDGFGLNHLHVEVLAHGQNAPLSKYTKPQVCKKTTENHGITPVHCAAINPKTCYLEELLNANTAAANKVVDKQNRTPIHFAAANVKPDAVKLLTKRGFDIRSADKKGITPLALAARFGRHQNIPLLVPKTTMAGETRKDFLNAAPKFGKPPIIEAASSGHAKTVEALVNIGADIDVPDKTDKKLAMHWAAERGHRAVVEILLSLGADVDAMDKKKRTPLMLAAMNGHAQVVDLLIESDAAVDAEDASRNSVLHYAAAYGWREICVKLVHAGADANAENEWKIKPHIVANIKGHVSIARYLMEQPDVSIDDRDNTGRTLVSLSMDDRHESTLAEIKFLVQEKGADVKIADLAGMTPLHYLAGGISHDDDQAIVKVLLDAGADIDARVAETDDTPLMLALKEQLYGLSNILVDALVDRGMGADGVDSSTGQNVFHKAVHLLEAEQNIVELIRKMLLLKGAKGLLTGVDASGLTPLLLLLQLASEGRLYHHLHKRQRENKKREQKKAKDTLHAQLAEITELFVDLGGKDVVSSVVVDWSDSRKEQEQKKAFASLSWHQRRNTTWDDCAVKQPCLGWTVLHMAVSLALPEIVATCLQAGANIDACGDDGVTPLQLALKGMGQQKPTRQDTHRRVGKITNATGEEEASEQQNRAKDIIMKLVQSGANVNTRDKEGKTCLFYAIVGYIDDASHDLSMLTLVSQKKADVSGLDSEGSTALHVAIRRGANLPLEAGKALIGLLLEMEGCDVGASDARGNTVMHVAAHECRSETATAFYALTQVVKNGGNINAKNKRGQTPLMYGLQANLYSGNGPQIDKSDPIELVSEVCNCDAFDINARDSQGCSALHYCSVFGCATSAIYLLQCNAELDATDALGNTALSLAVHFKHEGLAIMLFNQGAVARGIITRKVDRNSQEVQYFLPAKHNDGYDDKGLSSEMKTSKQKAERREDGAAELSSRNCSVFFQVISNQWKGLAYLMVSRDVPLTTAVKEAYLTSNEVMAVRLLQKAPKERLEKLEDGTGRNLFHVLSSLENVEPRSLDVVAEILDRTALNCALCDTTKEKMTPLHLAALNGRSDIAAMLLTKESAKAAIDAETEMSKETAIYTGARNGHVGLVKLLLDQKANANLQPRDGDSILLAAVRASRKDVIKVLLEHPASDQMDINCLGPDGRNCLHLAIDQNAVDTFEVLLEQKSIDVNAKDTDGNTPVHHVVLPIPELGSYENVAFLERLVQMGANPHLKNNEGRTPLFYASMYTSKKLVDALLATKKVLPDAKLRKEARDAAPEEMEEDPLISRNDDFDFTRDADQVRKDIEKKANKMEGGKNKKVPPVDPAANLGGSCEVVEDVANGRYFDITLNEMKADYGFYGRAMFYKMQVLRHKVKDMWILWTRYGRIGEIGQNQRTPFDDRLSAEKEFQKVFKSKTGNHWTKLDQFEKKPNKFVPIDIAEAEKARQLVVKSIDQLIAEAGDEAPECKLPDAVVTLLRAATDVKAMTQQMKQIDSSAMPLGQLSRTSLSKGYKILHDHIFPRIKKRDDLMKSSELAPDKIEKLESELSDFTNQYYELIPHNWSHSGVIKLDNNARASKEATLLENLMDLEVAVRILAGAQLQPKKTHPAHYIYQALDAGIHSLAREDPMFEAIAKYVKNTAHGNAWCHVRNILRVDIPGEADQFKDDLFPRKLLWHGSNLTNFLGILSQGLRIAPPHAEATGYMFGKGIYCADMLSKSIGYTSPRQLSMDIPNCSSEMKNKTKSEDDRKGGSSSKQIEVSYLILCEVALGKSSMEREAVYMERAKKGTQSTKGLGWEYPDELGDVVTFDGTTLPLGSVKRATKNKDDPKQDPLLLHNEYIVYDTKQVRMRYIVELSRTAVA